MMLHKKIKSTYKRVVKSTLKPVAKAAYKHVIKPVGKELYKATGVPTRPRKQPEQRAFEKARRRQQRDFDETLRRLKG